MLTFNASKNFYKPASVRHVGNSRVNFSSNLKKDEEGHGNVAKFTIAKGIRDFFEGLRGYPTSTTPRYEGLAFRIDNRGPEQMREAKSFKGRGGNLNIKKHVKGGPSNEESGFVSFATARHGTRPMQEVLQTYNMRKAKNNGQPTYLYAVELSSHNTFHASQYHAPVVDEKFDENEVVTKEASLTRVKWVEIHHKDDRIDTIRYPFAPRSDLAASEIDVPLKPEEIKPSRPI